MAGADRWRPIAEWILEDLTAAAGPSAGIVGPTTTAAYDGSHIWVRGYDDLSEGQRIGEEISRNVASVLKLGR